MLNSVTIMGRLTRDPELRYTQSSTPVASFAIACERDFGEEKKADFFEIVAWRKTAEFVQKHFFKGALVVINGRLQTQSYTDKTGQNRTKVEIVAEHVYFGQSKQSGTSETRGRTTVAPIDIDAGGFEELDDEGELPF